MEGTLLLLLVILLPQVVWTLVGLGHIEPFCDQPMISITRCTGDDILVIKSATFDRATSCLSGTTSCSADLTQHFRAACNTKHKCDYTVDYASILPCGGANFVKALIEYSCILGPGKMQTTLDPSSPYQTASPSHAVYIKTNAYPKWVSGNGQEWQCTVSTTARSDVSINFYEVSQKSISETCLWLSDLNENCDDHKLWTCTQVDFYSNELRSLLIKFDPKGLRFDSRYWMEVKAFEVGSKVARHDMKVSCGYVVTGTPTTSPASALKPGTTTTSPASALKPGTTTTTTSSTTTFRRDSDQVSGPTNEGTADSSSLPLWLIIAPVAGAVFLLLVVIIVVACCIKRCGTQEQRSEPNKAKSEPNKAKSDQAKKSIGPESGTMSTYTNTGSGYGTKSGTMKDDVSVYLGLQYSTKSSKSGNDNYYLSLVGEDGYQVPQDGRYGRPYKKDDQSREPYHVYTEIAEEQRY